MVFIFCCNNCPLCIAQWDSTFKIQGFVSMHTALCCIFQHMRLNLPRFGRSVELGHRWCLLRERGREARGQGKSNATEVNKTKLERTWMCRLMPKKIGGTFWWQRARPLDDTPLFILVRSSARMQRHRPHTGYMCTCECFLRRRKTDFSLSLCASKHVLMINQGKGFF